MGVSNPPYMSSVRSLDGEWLIATDPENIGREQGWPTAPRPEAKPTRVPWIIQGPFPGYHGVAWYWRTFAVPCSPHDRGRTLLRFWAVDYKAQVWVNGIYVGEHEGGETPFVLDVTEAVKSDQPNLLAVRVLNPTHDPIDGIVLNETPHRNKAMPYTAGSAWNQGGIMDSVELLLTPATYLEDLYARPDPTSGLIHIQATVRNTLERAVDGYLEFRCGPAASGVTIAAGEMEAKLAPGRTVVHSQLTIPEPHLWELNDPFLYRVTALVWIELSPSEDERSVRVGFRDFRFADGAFRLNGRRIFLRGSHTGNCCPIGLELPHDPDLLRRDLLNVKVMGFNMIRFIAGIPKRYQLDLCDEIGLLVYEESYAGWCLANSPHMAERFDRSTTEMILRDRNHPSVVIWGLLNETPDGPVFRHAVEVLALVRSLDDSRVVLLGSGRWDGQLTIGTLCNPGSQQWEPLLGDEGPHAEPTALAWGGYVPRAGDVHVYPRVPHTADTIRFLRSFGAGAGPVILTEYGIGSAVDLWRTVRHYERLGATEAEDAVFYRDKLERFLNDWERWSLADTFADPQDYFAHCLKKMAGQRLLGLNAIRANPHLVGYSLTGTVDQGMTGEGLVTTFRELKPGTLDAIFDGLAPLRLCLFAEPPVLYPNGEVLLEAVLANEDALAPGEYPVRLQVIRPDGRRALDETVTITVADPGAGGEPPLAQPIFSRSLVLCGPTGRYRFRAYFEHGAAATGGETDLYLAPPPDRLPQLSEPVAMWGDDPELAQWLCGQGVQLSLSDADAPGPRAILVGRAPAPGGATAFAALFQRIRAGATAVFLCPQVFRQGDDPVAHLPLPNRGTLLTIPGWLYLKDEWAKRHPLFEGLPAGGLMDYTFYRELIPDEVWAGQDPPAEAVAGAIKASQDYSSGLMLGVWPLGSGRVILNTLRLRDNLGQHPAADRLVMNLLQYACARNDG